MSILVLDARPLLSCALERVDSRSCSSISPIGSQALCTDALLQTMPAPAGLLELCSTSSTMPVLLRGVDRQQLHVAGFVEPAMRDHSLTGLCVHMLFAEAPERVEVLLG